MNRSVANLPQMIDLCIAKHGEQNEELITLVLTSISHEIDLSPFAGSILKLLPLPQLPLKKTVCTFLIRYSTVLSDLNILAMNTLSKDFKDPNPLIRKLVVKTVCSIPCLKDLSEEILPKALKDSSAAVRRTAVIHCSSVVEANHPVIETLYRMIRDPDAYVVSNCMVTLDSILKEEDGIVINGKMVSYLLGRISLFPEWCFVTVCKVLKKYKPKNEDEVIDFLNLFDDKFDSRNPVIFLATVQLFYYFLQTQCVHLLDDFFGRISNQLIRLLQDSSVEVLSPVIDIFETFIPRHKIISKHYTHFFCRFSDPVYIKVKKLSILPLICNDENHEEVMEELFTHCVDADANVSQKAVQSFVKILSSRPEAYDRHIADLIQLTDLKVKVFEDLIKLFNELELTLGEDLEKQFFALLSKRCLDVKSDETKENILWMISEYGYKIDSAPYIIELFFSTLASDSNEHLEVVLITTACKVFWSRPAEMQLLLGQILQKASKSQSSLVRNHALFYYNLFKCDQQLAKQFLCESVKLKQ